MARRPSFRDLIKHASSFLGGKLHQARLSLTDTTPAQLLINKATRGGRHSPDARTLKMISRAAFEIDDYWRIVTVLHRKLKKLDKHRWRKWYQALVVLEHLVVHGPDSASREFQPSSDVIRRQATAFHYVDERGISWGPTLRMRSERVLKLLERGPLIHEERAWVRGMVTEIQGFSRRDGGSVCADEVTALQIGAGECGRTSLYDENGEKESSVNSILGVTEQGDPWSCGRWIIKETGAWEEFHWSQGTMFADGGNWSGEVTMGVTWADANMALADESVQLLAAGNDSLLKSCY